MGYLKLESPVADLISLQIVENVPVRLPTVPGISDGNYLRTEPGLFPICCAP